MEKIKARLKSENKNAVRIVLKAYGWGGPQFDIVLDEQKVDDVVVEIDGVKFVAKRELEYFLNKIEIVEIDGDFHVRKRTMHYCWFSIKLAIRPVFLNLIYRFKKPAL